MKDADGVVITSVEKQTQLWKTHFETILNKEAPIEVEDIPERDEDLLVNMDPPTANEVKSAIDNMKSGKVPGADGVSAEMLKAGGDVITETLNRDFQGNMGRRRNTRRLEDRTYHETAKETKPKPLQKLERDHTTVHHQQSIQQSDLKQNIYSPRPNATQRTGRIQERKILRRTHIHPTTDSRTMPGMENSKTPCYVNFIDFEKAFDSIHRESLFCILRYYVISCKIVTIIKMYEGFKKKVICGQHLTEEFDIKTGVKQRCILSLFLFCLAIDRIMKRTVIGIKSRIIWTFIESLGDLDFADDILC